MADTFLQRYRGLSEYESPNETAGLLFIHPFEKKQSYVMRGMSFPIDILFFDSSGTLTTLHKDVRPEDAGLLTNWSGVGKYVLETPSGWATSQNLSEGDTVTITLQAQG